MIEVKSLKKYRKCLIEGVAEVPRNNKLRIYDREQTLNELKKKFIQWKFEITNIEEIQKHPYAPTNYLPLFRDGWELRVAQEEDGETLTRGGCCFSSVAVADPDNCRCNGIADGADGRSSG